MAGKIAQQKGLFYNQIWPGQQTLMLWESTRDSMWKDRAAKGKHTNPLSQEPALWPYFDRCVLPFAWRAPSQLRPNKLIAWWRCPPAELGCGSAERCGYRGTGGSPRRDARPHSGIAARGTGRRDAGNGSAALGPLRRSERCCSEVTRDDSGRLWGCHWLHLTHVWSCPYGPFPRLPSVTAVREKR